MTDHSVGIKEIIILKFGISEFEITNDSSFVKDLGID